MPAVNYQYEKRKKELDKKKKKAEKLISAYGKIPLKWTKKTLRDYRD